VREQRITVYTWYFPYYFRGDIHLTLLRCTIRNTQHNSYMERQQYLVCQDGRQRNRHPRQRYVRDTMRK